MLRRVHYPLEKDGVEDNREHMELFFTSTADSFRKKNVLRSSDTSCSAAHECRVGY